MLRAQIVAAEQAVKRLRESGVKADPRLLVDIEAWLTNVRQQLEDPREPGGPPCPK